MFTQRCLTAVLAAGLGLGAALVATPAAQAASGYHGCPSGAFCIYPGATFNHDRPEYVFFSYAGHNIYGETGVHRFVNNQTGGAAFGLCRGSNGKGGSLEGGTDPRPQPEDVSFTKVNSIDLRPHSFYAAHPDRMCRR